MRNKDEEIRITNVPRELKNDLSNISKNLGVSLTHMLKPILREVRDKYPEEMRRTKPD